VTAPRRCAWPAPPPQRHPPPGASRRWLPGTAWPGAPGGVHEHRLCLREGLRGRLAGTNQHPNGLGGEPSFTRHPAGHRHGAERPRELHLRGGSREPHPRSGGEPRHNREMTVHGPSPSTLHLHKAPRALGREARSSSTRSSPSSTSEEIARSSAWSSSRTERNVLTSRTVPTAHSPGSGTHHI
jgi:hypothetical protein